MIQIYAVVIYTDDACGVFGPFVNQGEACDLAERRCKDRGLTWQGWNQASQERRGDGDMEPIIQVDSMEFYPPFDQLFQHALNDMEATALGIE